MTLALAWAALRRRPFSVLCTAVLVSLSASMVGAPTPLVLAVWAAVGLLCLATWHAAESFVLRWRAWRAPTRVECERLDLVPACARVTVLVIDRPEPWLGRGLRCLLVTRGLLDLVEDRALVGLLSQAAAEIPSASLAGELLVWAGNLPLVGAWWLSRWLGQLGRLLAIAVGASLVVPLLLWPGGFVRSVGRLFGALLAGLLGSALLSSGLAAPGLALLLAWAIVPGLHKVLAWESRRAERLADQATVDAGLGWQLLEAIETLVWTEAMPAPDALVGLLARADTPLTMRADRIWRALSQT